MNMLGIDTSMAHTSVCVVRADGRSFGSDAPEPGRVFEQARHSAELLPAIARQLDRAGIDWGDLDSISVGVGPGTFTGLRIGVATARALAQSLGLQVRPVSSLQALAAGLADRADPDALLCPLLDARRKEVFAAGFKPSSPAPEALWGPEALPPESLIERLGHASAPVLAAGDWALESKDILVAAGIGVSEDPASHAVNALQVCRVAGVVDPVEPFDVVPTYVRLPDAEINRRAAGKRG